MAAQEQIHRHRQQRLIGVRPEAVDTPRRRAPPPPHPTITASESGLAIFTMIWLTLYVPVETYAAAKGTGLLRLSYLVDVAGMGLLGAGVMALWRARSFAGAVTAAGWAWNAANFWRGTMERAYAIDHGRTVFLGSFAVWIGSAVTVGSMAAVAVALWVAIRRADTRA